MELAASPMCKLIPGGKDSSTAAAFSADKKKGAVFSAAAGFSAAYSVAAEKSDHPLEWKWSSCKYGKNKTISICLQHFIYINLQRVQIRYIILYDIKVTLHILVLQHNAFLVSLLFIYFLFHSIFRNINTFFNHFFNHFFNLEVCSLHFYLHVNLKNIKGFIYQLQYIFFLIH